MRVATDQLLAAVLGHRGEVARAALLQQQREEVDLEEHVAELVEQLRVVATMRRVRQLVRLLERVRHDRALVLLAIPRALAPQPPRQLVEAHQRLLDLRTARAHARQVTQPPPEVLLPDGVATVPPDVEVVFGFGAFLQSGTM